jgi:hypothetical protein
MDETVMGSPPIRAADSWHGLISIAIPARARLIAQNVEAVRRVRPRLLSHGKAGVYQARHETLAARPER